MRTINAIFEIEGDCNITGVSFECDGKRLDWNDLTRLEQIRMLNAWAKHHELFYKFVKQEN